MSLLFVLYLMRVVSVSIAPISKSCLEQSLSKLQEVLPVVSRVTFPKRLRLSVTSKPSRT